MFNNKNKFVMNKYKVIKGIFEGTEFNGKIINNRVYNLDTEGQSYSIEYCVIIDKPIEIVVPCVIVGKQRKIYNEMEYNNVFETLKKELKKVYNTINKPEYTFSSFISKVINSNVTNSHIVLRCNGQLNIAFVNISMVGQSSIEYIGRNILKVA